MKILFKSAVTLSFIAIICIVLSLLLSAMKELFISSWFVFNKSVIVGVLSGLVLTCIIALVQFMQYQRENAKERAEQLRDFRREADAFQAIVTKYSTTGETLSIPDEEQQALGTTLTRLNERSMRMLRYERLSPLKSGTATRFRRFASPMTKAESAFFTALLPFAESAHAAENAHHILPYLTDSVEIQKNRSLLRQSLQQMLTSLAQNGALDTVFLQYQKEVHRFLGIKKQKAAVAV